MPALCQLLLWPLRILREARLATPEMWRDIFTDERPSSWRKAVDRSWWYPGRISLPPTMTKWSLLVTSEVLEQLNSKAT